MRTGSVNTRLPVDISQLDRHGAVSAGSGHTSTSGGAAANETHAVQSTRAVTNKNLSKSQLAAGDILLLVDQPDNTTLTHKIIKNGQRLPSLSMLRSNKGEPGLVHALMWSRTQTNPGQDRAGEKGEPEIVEMAGRDLQSSASGPLQPGLYKVYSPKDKNLGDWAAQVGLIWSEDKGISYSKKKSVLSVVKNSSFKGLAKKESFKYGTHAFENKPAIRGAFCSHFVLAAYQAAAHKIGLPLKGALKVDAEATSVRTLEHFLKKDVDGFSFKGLLNISPEQVSGNN